MRDVARHVHRPLPAEVEPLRSREWVDLLLNGADGLVLRVDGSGTIVEAAETVLAGIEGPSLVGRDLLGLFDPDHRASIADVLTSDDEGGSSPDRTFIGATGLVRVDVVTRRTGSTTLLVVRDPWSSRLERNRLARLAAERLKIYEHIGDGFFMLDSEWNVTYMNPIAVAMTGGDATDRIGRNLWDSFPELRETRFFS